MKLNKYNVTIFANIVRTSFDIEAPNEEKAHEQALELWGDTKIKDMARVDVVDYDVMERQDTTNHA